MKYNLSGSDGGTGDGQSPPFRRSGKVFVFREITFNDELVDIMLYGLVVANTFLMILWFFNELLLPTLLMACVFAPLFEECGKSLHLIRKQYLHKKVYMISCVVIGIYFALIEVVIYSNLYANITLWDLRINLLFHPLSAMFIAMVYSYKPSKKYYVIAIIPVILIHAYYNLQVIG